MLHNGLLQLSLDNAKARYMGSQTEGAKIAIDVRELSNKKKQQQSFDQKHNYKIPPLYLRLFHLFLRLALPCSLTLPPAPCRTHARDGSYHEQHRADHS